MPNGQTLELGSLGLRGQTYPKGFYISFRYSGWNRSPSNPRLYEGQASEPEVLAGGRMQNLLYHVRRSDNLGDGYDVEERWEEVEEECLGTFVEDKFWVVVQGRLMVFQKR
jgi:hypothetical protein